MTSIFDYLLEIYFSDSLFYEVSSILTALFAQRYCNFKFYDVINEQI